MILRSASVRYANVTSTRLMTTNALMTAHPPGSTAAASRLHHLDRLVEVGGVLVGDARDARRRACGSTRARSSTEVPFERTTTASPVAIAAPLGVVRPTARPRRSGRWKCELGDALDGGPGEERPVADAAGARRRSARRRASAAVRRRRRRGLGRCVRRAAPAAARARRARRGSRPPKMRSRRARRRRRRRAGESSTSKRAASFAIQASSSGHGRR